MTNKTYFYPEAGMAAPSTALVIGRFALGYYIIKWEGSDNDAVVSAMKAAKAAPKNVKMSLTAKSDSKWSALMTPKAYTKLQMTGIVATEMFHD
ncbi:MAG: hypothetical protein ACRYG8_43980 [Janthinobacterium lividum]